MGGMRLKVKPGDIITVRHYSLLNAFKSVIASVGDSSLVLRIPREFSAAYFSVGDPIVLAFSYNENIHICGARIQSCSPNREAVEVRLDEFEEGARTRSYERTPVSHYADIRVNDNGKKCFALVKDISYHGMLVFTNEKLYRGQLLDLDVFLDKDIISLKAEVVRMYQGPVYMEYGLKIVHRGPAVYNHIKNYVTKTQESLVNRFNRD